jgi:predicted aspartyl protease
VLADATQLARKEKLVLNEQSKRAELQPKITNKEQMTSTEETRIYALRTTARFKMKESVKDEDEAQKVTVTLGRGQLSVKPESTQKETIVCKHWWKSYLNWAKEYGLQHSEHRRIMTLPRRQRRKNLKTVMVNDSPVEVYGPYEARMNIDAVEMHCEVYVTKHDFPEKMVIGADLWLPMNTTKETATIASISQTEKGASEPALKLYDHCKLWLDVGNTRSIALIDTGACVSVMPWTILEREGMEREQLLPNQYDLMSASATKMNSLGITPPIKVRLGGKELTHQFVVVDTMMEEVTLIGRDFLIEYDVVVDIPRQSICIRNHKKLYNVEVRQIGQIA